MGYSIWPDSGFLLEFSRFVKLLCPQHLHGIKYDAARLYQRFCDSFGYSGAYKQMVEYVHLIKSAMDIEEVSQILVKCVEQNIQENQQIVLCCDFNRAEMELIRCVSRVVLPCEPDCVRMFRKKREEGWYVPIGEPVLVFPFGSCFETRMNPSGRALARTLGRDEIAPVMWTVTSS